MKPKARCFLIALIPPCFCPLSHTWRTQQSIRARSCVWRPINRGLNRCYFLGLLSDDELYEAVPLKTKIITKTLKRVQKHMQAKNKKRNLLHVLDRHSPAFKRTKKESMCTFPNMKRVPYITLPNRFHKVGWAPSVTL